MKSMDVGGHVSSPDSVPLRPDDGSHAPASATPARRARAWSLALAAVVLLAALLVALHIRAYTTISPIDELQHLDYALKLGDGELISRGESFGIEAMREEACRGVDAQFQPPPCDQPELRPEEFQEGGENTAEPHPPVYYAVEGVGGRLVESLPGIASPVTAARLMGTLWLGAAVVLLWFALAELRIRPAARVPVLILVASAPTVLHAAATVNPDGTGLALGAATLLVVLRWEARRASPWLLALIGVAAALTKVTNLVGVAVGVLYIALRWLQARSAASGAATGAATDEDEASGEAPEHDLPDGAPGGRNATRPSVVAIGALVSAFLVATVAWMVVGALKAGPDEGESTMSERFAADAISVDEFADNVFAGLSPLRDPYLPEQLASPVLRLAGSTTDRLVLAGVVAGLVASRARSRTRALALASIVVMVGFGPFFVLFNFVAIDSYFPVPPRYALSLVPAAAAVAAAALDRTLPGRILLGAGAALGSLAMVAALM